MNRHVMLATVFNTIWMLGTVRNPISTVEDMLETVGNGYEQVGNGYERLGMLGTITNES